MGGFAKEENAGAMLEKPHLLVAQLMLYLKIFVAGVVVDRADCGHVIGQGPRAAVLHCGHAWRVEQRPAAARGRRVAEKRRKRKEKTMPRLAACIKENRAKLCLVAVLLRLLSSNKDPTHFCVVLVRVRDAGLISAVFLSLH
eukprot:440861-Pelagomonas_calceolata.AAC.2